MNAMRDRFFHWQCKLRQIAVRQDGGRPSPGMRPRLLAADGAEIAPALTTLLVPERPSESTAFFRFQVQKSDEPQAIYERGLAFLQAEYFQEPDAFSDQLAAVLPEGSDIAPRLSDGGCILEFEQWRQFFRLPCKATRLSNGDPAREAALWHNRIFNTLLPDSVHVFAFQPDWTAATAQP